MLPDEVNPAIGTWNPSCTGTSRDLSDNACTYDADATCVGVLTAAQVTLCQSLGGCRNPVFIYRAHTEWDPSLDSATGICGLFQESCRLNRSFSL
jgi:hypothetical protein